MLTNEFESSKELFTQISVAHSENKAEDPFYSEENMRFLRNAVSALNEGKGIEHELVEVD